MKVAPVNTLSNIHHSPPRSSDPQPCSAPLRPTGRTPHARPAHRPSGVVTEMGCAASKGLTVHASARPWNDGNGPHRSAKRSDPGAVRSVLLRSWGGRAVRVKNRESHLSSEVETNPDLFCTHSRLGTYSAAYHLHVLIFGLQESVMSHDHPEEFRTLR